MVLTVVFNSDKITLGMIKNSKSLDEISKSSGDTNPFSVLTEKVRYVNM